MYRVAVSLLAFLGAVTLSQREGRADPPATRPAAKSDNAAAKDESEAPLKKKDAPTSRPKGADGDTNSQKAAGAGANSKKSGDGDGKKTAASSAEKSPSKVKAAPAWTKGQPGVVKLVRGSETLEVRVLDRRQRLVPATLAQFAKFLRSKSGADHPIDGRLVTLVATVSDHFGGREVNVVSGFRPYSPGQYSRHSNHNEGRAIDFSIKGIANETVRDFCRTLRNVGVGYYPNSLFVHLDVRDKNTYWVDYAAPGQAPRYHPADSRSGDDDEGDGVASVDDGGGTTASPSDTPRSDVTRGKTNGRGGDRDSTGERGVFVNR
jgi:uncharacterized protein YcbK (DUF882 family)